VKNAKGGYIKGRREYIGYSSNNLQHTFDALFQNYEVHKYCELGKRGSGSVVFLYASKKLDP
jgi:hypothetical protein